MTQFSLLGKGIRTKSSGISHFFIWQGSLGKSEHSDWFFLGWDFATDCFHMETVISRIFLVFKNPYIQGKSAI